MHILAFAETWDIQSTAPSALRILTYDLQTGDLVNDLSLLEQDYGSGLSDGSSNIRSMVGWDISPDGSRIAIMPANQSGIRLIETNLMTVVSSPLVLQAVASRNTLEPVPGECVGTEQTSGLAFAPDGLSVYVTWLEYACLGGAAVQYRPAGVRVVDLKTGTERISTVPDGLYIMTGQAGTASVYAIRVNLPESGDFSENGGMAIVQPSETSLVRLDAETLTIAAERPLPDDFLSVLIVP